MVTQEMFTVPKLKHNLTVHMKFSEYLIYSNITH